MLIEFSYEPMPIHRPFHESRAKERACFGAFGSGKTYALCSEAIAWALAYPGITGLVCRKTVPELRDTTETVFIEILPFDLHEQCTIKRTGGHIDRVIFPNGSEVLFRSLDDWNKLRSMNLGFIAFDEANEIDEETYQGMLSRVRQREPLSAARRMGVKLIPRRGAWLATNPGGHDWVWKRFVNPDTRKADTDYFKSTSFDNPYLPVDYLDQLLQYPPEWRRRYVYCSFENFAEQIFTDLDSEKHIVPEPKWNPATAVWMGMDPGTREKNPTAGLWVVVNPEKRTLTAIREYEAGNRSAQEHVAHWRQIENKMNVKWRVSDPGSINIRDRGSNMKLSDQYARLGYNFALGPKTYPDRISALGSLITQGRFLFTEQTMGAFEQVQQYRWKELTPAQKKTGEDPKDEPLKKNDHLVDCAQYLSSRWVAPMKRSGPPPDETFSQKAQRLIRKQIVEKNTWTPRTNESSMVI